MTSSLRSLFVRRRLWSQLNHFRLSSFPVCSQVAYSLKLSELPNAKKLFPPSIYRGFCSQSLNLNDIQGPTVIDYSTLLTEDEFHKLADSTLNNLLEKFEEYGDGVQIDGFDVDYGNQVLTLKLGRLGTYVINKQTPNRQIWLSSPISGPSRFDWDASSQAWVYRRTKSNLLPLLQKELEQLCGEPISLN